MRPALARTFAAVLGAAALSATLTGCIPSAPSGEDLASLTHGSGYVSLKEFTPVTLGETIENDLFTISFNSANWSNDYLRIGDVSNVNLIVEGTFTNKNMERYRLGSSADVYFEPNKEYFISGLVGILKDGQFKNYDYVEPGETVTFGLLLTVPRSSQKTIDEAVVSLSLYKASFSNGTYETHASEPIGEYIFNVDLKKD